MVSDEEFRALQQRVDQLERLVTNVDRDVAAVQAQRRADLDLLMALRGTQLEQGEQLTRQGEQLTRQGLQITQLQQLMTTGLQEIIGRLDRMQPGER